jgi:protein YIPF6
MGYLMCFCFNLASIAFVGEMIPVHKRKLALYPIILFYLFLSWFVLIV